MINRGGRSARSSAAQSLGANDPRLRRNQQSQATDNDLGAGLGLDSKGRIEVAVARTSPFFYNEDGEIDFNADDGTEVTPGSRPALRLKAADSSIEITRDGVRARPTAEQVKRPTGETVEAALVAGTDTVTALSATVTTNTSDIATLNSTKASTDLATTGAAGLVMQSAAVTDSAAGTPADLPEAIIAIGVLEDKINELLASMRASGQLET